MPLAPAKYDYPILASPQVPRADLSFPLRTMCIRPTDTTGCRQALTTSGILSKRPIRPYNHSGHPP